MGNYLTVLFSILVSIYGQGQSLTTVNFTTENGLPSSQVYDIIQDTYGFLWFSTDKGLCRYNGYEFENFDKQDGIIDNVVFDFHKRPNGEIWCTTNSAKLFKISGRTPTFSEYKYNDSIAKYADNLVNNGVLFHKDGGISLSYHGILNFVTILKDGTVSIKPKVSDKKNLNVCVVKDSTNEPFFYYTKKNKKAYPYNHDIHVSFFDSSYPSIHIEALATDGVQFYKVGNKLKWIYPDRVVVKTSETEVIASGFLTKDKYWLGYRYRGVEVYHEDGRKLRHFLTDKSVTQLFEDHEGNYWVSTLEDGVFRFMSKKMFLIEQTKGVKISSIEAGDSSGVFIGYDNGSVYQRTNKGGMKQFYKPKEWSLPVKMKYFDGKLIFSSDYIKYCSLLTGKNTNINVGGGSNYIELFNKKGLLYGLRSTMLSNRFAEIEDKKQSIFPLLRMNDVSIFKEHIYGGNKSGLYVSDYPNSKKVTQLFENIRIDDLNLFNNWLVLGTNGDGIKIMDEQHNEQYSITRKDGLLSNFVAATYSENDSTLWVCTNQGANRIVFQRNGGYTIKSVTINDGLLSNEVWDLTVQNDTVWIGTQKGVNYISIHDFNEQNSVQRNFYLQWLGKWVNGQSIPENGYLSYDQNEVKFRFLGLSFKNKKLKYRYKLEGFHKKWQTTRNRSLTFSALAPGTYKLILEVEGSDLTMKESSITYSFTIQKPFWKTWWFICVTVVVLGGLILGFFKVRILTYNKDIVREIAIYMLRKIRRESPYVLIKQNGKEIRLYTSEIYFMKTEGNYLQIYTKDKKFMIRSSISKFIDKIPDKLEFIQVHRSYIVRIEHVEQKSKTELIVLEQVIPVGRKYQDQVELIKMA